MWSTMEKNNIIILQVQPKNSMNYFDKTNIMFQNLFRFEASLPIIQIECIEIKL